MRKIYLSGPLFSRGEISWGEQIKSFLVKRIQNIDVVWPHEIVPDNADTEIIFKINLIALEECDLMIAILDGAQVDDGTAWEIGFFYSCGKKIIGMRTDFRSAGESTRSKVNAMVECSCVSIVENLEQLILEINNLLNHN